MAKVCDLTGKKTSFGHRKKHKRGSSGGSGVWQYKAQKTKRKWEPNLRKVKAINLTDGKVETLTVSMRAYKKLRQEESFRGYKLVDHTVKTSKAIDTNKGNK